ncbi:MAG TPA: ubiquinol-cytochrome C reductase, partial [Propionibacterium sp.]|nr:ubiquinol-cytochrome C reductase [Propionibacterium sp.]
MTPEHSTALVTTEDDALLHPVPNPGIEEHIERYTDVDAKAADRAYKQVV